jgi:hypothetical protein
MAAVALLVWKSIENHIRKMELKQVWLELQIKYLKNKQRVEDDNKGRSDSDIVRDIFNDSDDSSGKS